MKNYSMLAVDVYTTTNVHDDEPYQSLGWNKCGGDKRHPKINTTYHMAHRHKNRTINTGIWLAYTHTHTETLKLETRALVLVDGCCACVCVWLAFIFPPDFPCCVRFLLMFRLFSLGNHKTHTQTHTHKYQIIWTKTQRFDERLFMPFFMSENGIKNRWMEIDLLMMMMLMIYDTIK